MEKRSIIFWNLGRLFGSSGSPIQYALTQDSAASRATREDVEKKLDVVAATIDAYACKLNSPPLAVGLCEIENNNLARRLAKKIKSAKLRAIDDVIVDEAGAALDGLNISILTDDRKLKAISLRSHIVDRTFDTRDILEADFEIGGEEFSLIVNHWPSRLSSEGEGRRSSAAQYVSKLVESKIRFQLSEMWDKNALKLNVPRKKLIVERSRQPIVVMGDLNDEVFDQSVSLLSSTPEIDVVNDDLKLKGRTRKDRFRSYRASKHYLLNQFWNFAGKRGSYYYGGRWRTYDQILVSKGLCGQFSDKAIEYRVGSADIFTQQSIVLPNDENWNLTNRNGKPILFDPIKSRGCSDHFPVSISVQIQRSYKL